MVYTGDARQPYDRIGNMIKEKIKELLLLCDEIFGDLNGV